jgi:hypothetical protein
MKRILPALAVLLLLVPATASAQGTTSNALDLLRWCDGREPDFMPELGPLLCSEYLGGLNDMHGLLTDPSLPTAAASKLYCAPALQGEQLVRIFVKFANEHPERLHGSPRIVFLEAMAQALPCDR